MKIRLFLLMLCLPGIIWAQNNIDTIYVKNGNVVPAVIVSKDNTVVKYREPSGTGSNAVYTIFLSDIKSIHYADGRIADLQGNELTTEVSSKTTLDQAGNYNIGRVSFGIGPGYFMRSQSDNLDEFWAMASKSQTLGGNPLYFAAELLKISFVTSQSRRNWVSSALQLVLLPSDAIHASGNNGLDEISIGSYSINIILNYGYAFNTKKNVIAVIDPGVDFNLMNGFIKLNGVRNDLFSGLRTGMHLGTGIDWLFSKILHANFRAGYRFSKAFNEDHSTDGSIGFHHFTINGDPVQIKWSGFYVSAGIAASFYFDAAKMAQNRTIRQRR